VLVINSLLVASYLIIAASKDAVARESVLYQLTGGISAAFWLGVVFLGVIVPVTAALYSYFAGEAVAAILIIAAACDIVGGMLLRYCLLKSAVYRPLVGQLS